MQETDTIYVPSTRVQGSSVCLAPCRGQQLHTVPPLFSTVPRGHTSITVLSSGETEAQRAAWGPIRRWLWRETETTPA